ncbi:hypothetical protein [Thermoactinospora rubra]|uniref:hypothetical protein n=1 Tax=Thermoactinospora rubra TaxID=1088767 RepID=UPI00117FD5A9|nr:hypothetical protein [Thermoactinospora rubra]
MMIKRARPLTEVYGTADKSITNQHKPEGVGSNGASTAPARPHGFWRLGMFAASDVTIPEPPLGGVPAMPDGKER